MQKTYETMCIYKKILTFPALTQLNLYQTKRHQEIPKKVFSDMQDLIVYAAYIYTLSAFITRSWIQQQINKASQRHISKLLFFCG